MLTQREKFESKVFYGSPDGCHYWTGYVMYRGYGTAFYMSKVSRAHRVAYEIYKGPIEEGQCVCHSCDNRICVNPEHLFLGTNKDNMEDRNKKKRQMHGTRHWMAKLKDSDVIEIRRMATSGYSRPSIAAQYGVTLQTICGIHKRKTWKHI